MANTTSIRLPRQWQDHVKSGILHAVALASTAIAAAHTRVARRWVCSPNPDPLGLSF